MTTFDYRRAWFNLAKPAYLSLSLAVRELFAAVALAAAELRQLPDLSMPWPSESPSIRARFEAIAETDPDELAIGARAIYFTGHWYPADGDLTLPGREHGAHWKFAHYADQVLRQRFNIPVVDYDRAGVSLQILEGAFRVGYSSRSSWTWREVAPATPDGFVAAGTIAGGLNRAIAKFPRNHTRKRDAAAWEFMEALPKSAADRWPAGYWEWFADTSGFMVEESEIVKAASDPGAFDVERERARVLARTAEKIDALKAEEAGHLWLLDHGCLIDNAIYYGHTRRWCFGWRTALTPAAISTWLDVLTEFPYDYDIRGYTPGA